MVIEKKVQIRARREGVEWVSVQGPDLTRTKGYSAAGGGKSRRGHKQRINGGRSETIPSSDEGP